jgi:TonB-dependent receptor
MLATAGSACAATALRRNFDVPADLAAVSLKVFSAQSGLEVLIPSALSRSTRTHPVRGEMTPREALFRMLEDTDLEADEDTRTGAFAVRRRRGPPSKSAMSSAESPPSSRATGTVVGRVMNATTGTYLNQVRVTVAETAQATFTNEFGEYRLTGIPAGAARLRVFFTGYPEQRATVVVAPKRIARQDFALDRVDASGAQSTVVLEPLVVASTREMAARAVALQEQRFASNLKNVVSTDELGEWGNSDIGDFIKFMPGVIVDGEQVSLRGLPPHTVPITIDGDRLASQFSNEQSLRSTALDSAALNNVARIEVAKTLMPDIPADSLGGSINLVSKRAFERRTPVFNYHLYATAAARNLSWDHQTGPSPRTSVRPVRPGIDFAYIAPVSETFGFTLTGIAFDQFNVDYIRRPFWAPHAVSREGATPAHPYLAQFAIQNQVSRRTRASLGTTADWRAGPENVLSVGIQYTYAKTDFNTNSHNADVSGQNNALPPVAYGPTFTVGAPHAARLQYAGSTRRVPITSVMARLNHRHDGAVWRTEASAFYSSSSSRLRDIDYGHFRNTQLRLSSATLRFDGVDGDNPGTVTVQNATGQPVAPYELGDYVIATVFSQPKDELDVIWGGRGHFRRELPARFPLSLKAGLDWREQTRDLRSPFPRWDFVGPDGVAGSADDVASRHDVMNSGYTDGGGRHAAFATVQWPSQYKLYALFREQPAYFRLNETATLAQSTALSRRIIETVSAAYLRFDARLLRDRLTLAGGVRFEHTNAYGEGQWNDASAAYLQDSAGRLMRAADGQPIPISTDPIVRARAQYRERGARAERDYDGFFPSLNATFLLRDDLVARFACARAFGRPDFGFIVPAIAVSDPGAIGAIRTITLSDPGLRPWTSRNFDLALEYYFKRGGILSGGVFQKNLSDFFATTRAPATPEQLAGYGLNGDYLGYEIVRTTNGGDARLEGLELSFRQQVDVLPSWAGGLQVFANLTHLSLRGSNTADFDTFVPRSYNWGASLHGKRTTLSLNWHRRGRQRMNLVTGAFTPAQTFVYTVPHTMLDVNFEHQLGRGLSLYGVIRNATGTTRQEEVYAQATPHYARLRSLPIKPIALTLGIKGQF